MKSMIYPVVVTGLSLVCALAAGGQTLHTPNDKSANLPATVHNVPTNSKYDYDFISKELVWSNQPLNATAKQICGTMRDHAFTETPYAITDDKDWNSCLDVQIRSIGYMRWLRNDYGFKTTSKNRKKAKDYLEKTYSMGPWGSYTFTQLRAAVGAAVGQQP